MDEANIVSGYAETFVQVIAATVSGDLIHLRDLTALDNKASSLYCAVSNGEQRTYAELKVLDSLLSENNPSLLGEIFHIYNEANNFLEPIYDLTDLVSEVDYLAEQYEVNSQ
mgnify:CR=1 FL=1